MDEADKQAQAIYEAWRKYNYGWEVNGLILRFAAVLREKDDEIAKLKDELDWWKNAREVARLEAEQSHAKIAELNECSRK
jgi:hypothetical protein